MDEQRGVMLQCFHWYSPSDGRLWHTVARDAGALADAGFTALWLPPAYKGAGGGYDTGYGVYDMYDLGEFDQKGTVGTKYGTKGEYLAAIDAAHRANLSVYADIVLNHRMGADTSEIALATPFPRNDRTRAKGPAVEIEAFTRYVFPGRRGKYSTFTWNWWHFDAVDHDKRNPDDHDTVYLFEGKDFDNEVSGEYGNYDYLMGCDLDFGSPEVRDELTRWGRWHLDTTGVDGFRIDAVKHIPAWFFPQWLKAMCDHARKDLFSVAEFWDPDLDNLRRYIDMTAGLLSLFDVPLHFAFHTASIARADYDLRTIFDGSLVQVDPHHAVTFVANHDSQPLQALESVVEPWFKPLAYALVLLRREGYPCVFAADYEGASYRDRGNDGQQYDIEMPSFKPLLDKLLEERKTSTFGQQRDYFDHPNTIGWTFSGDASHPGSMAVLLSNGNEGTKRMETGKRDTTYVDCTGNRIGSITTDAQGFGEFHCNGASVSVWIETN
ncbi:MAG: alpha-amylase [Spirochaetae bacterium HGW-Spirochaetae-2]|jgi:alpha-amylase|nr:MAG: alpha-amylase [Spirochaetae bacterium HGW-Spirochaetae-2]